MLWWTFFGFLPLIEAILTQIPDSHAAHEAGETESSRWKRGDHADPESRVLVKIGLAQSNLDRAHDWLMEVSDSALSTYGQHWTQDEVIQAFQPDNDTVSSVLGWLQGNGIPNDVVHQSQNKLWLAFFTTVGHLESMLYAEYYQHEDIETGDIQLACERYHLPRDIQHMVDYVTPGIVLPPRKRKPRVARQQTHLQYRRDVDVQVQELNSSRPACNTFGAGEVQPCSVRITPACIAALYDIPQGHLSHSDNSMGIFETQLQPWDQKDLNIFYSNCYPDIPNGTHPISHNIDGGVAKTKNMDKSGSETNLDLDTAYPIVYPQTITVFDVDDLLYQKEINDTYTWGFNTFLDAIDGSYCTYKAFGETGDLKGVDPTYPDKRPGGYHGKLQCGVFKPTNVLSFSYAGPEAALPIAYQKRQCNEFLKLGLQGVSVFFASGDDGTGNAIPGETGSRCLGPAHTIFSPSWPNTCPYVTSVGGTEIASGKTVSDPEVAARSSYPKYTSGGGFSNIYPIPKYQKAAVANYFASHDPEHPYYSALAPNTPNPAHPNVTALAGSTGGVYNRIGRGIPDVSANSVNIANVAQGFLGLNEGTSASTPIFASIINRINEERIAAGKSTLGFINPTLYAHPGVLNDIVKGNNQGCSGPGFNATGGWDPVTGLGTPNYPKMLKLFMSI